MIVRPDADRLLAGELGQWLQDQGDARAQAKVVAGERLRKGLVGAAIVFVVVTIFTRDSGTGFSFGALAALMAWGWAEKAKKPVVDAIKSGINGAIAKALDMTYSATAEPGNEFDRLRRFGLLPDYDKVVFEDCWCGNVGDRSFRLYEAHLTKRETSDDKVRDVTQFQGSVICIGFARRFHGITLVEREKTRRTWFGLGGDRTELEFGGVKLQRCDMVDPRFEAEFTVWSNDAVEARYLVHPAYIERLIAVEQAYAGQNIRTLFDGGTLIVALESGDLFESGSIDAKNDRRLLERTIEQFGTLADLAEQLNERARGNY